MFDDRRRLEDRVYRLRTGFAWSQAPASRTVRLITNVEVFATDRDDTRMLRSNFLISEFWGDETRSPDRVGRMPRRSRRRSVENQGKAGEPDRLRSVHPQSQHHPLGPLQTATMSNLKLTLACGRYDRTQPLIDGRVQPQGVDLTYLPLRPGETFWRMLNHGEFDVSEMSLSSYTILRSEGDTRFVAIPVFPSRVFRHSAVYLRADSTIEKPQELKGKRIGVGDYQMTAAVWVRGFLAHEYGVMPQDVVWVTGSPVRSIKPPPGVRIEALPPDTTLDAMLERGEIDALATVVIPEGLGNDDPSAVSRSAQGRERVFQEDRHFSDHAYGRPEESTI